MSEGTARETAVGIAAEALYYDIGNAYETEKTWDDLGRHVRAPYLDTVETIFKRLAERGYTITEAGALAPAGLTRTVTCGPCQGSGGAWSECPVCNGTGAVPAADAATGEPS